MRSHQQVVSRRSHPAQPGADQKQVVIRRSHPAKYGEDRFGPPTLERSGSEQRWAVTSPLPEDEGLGEKVELSLQERRRGRKFSTEGGYIPAS